MSHIQKKNGKENNPLTVCQVLCVLVVMKLKSGHFSQKSIESNAKDKVIFSLCLVNYEICHEDVFGIRVEALPVLTSALHGSDC